MTIAAEHAGEAADTLRIAVAIEDPSWRADIVWEALERVRCAAEHLSAVRSSVFTAVIARLDDGGDGSAELIADDALEECAHALDDLAQTLGGIAPARRAYPGRCRSPARQLDRPLTTTATRVTSTERTTTEGHDLTLNTHRDDARRLPRARGAGPRGGAWTGRGSQHHPWTPISAVASSKAGPRPPSVDLPGGAVTSIVENHARPRADLTSTGRAVEFERD